MNALTPITQIFKDIKKRFKLSGSDVEESTAVDGSKGRKTVFTVHSKHKKITFNILL